MQSLFLFLLQCKIYFGPNKYNRSCRINIYIDKLIKSWDNQANKGGLETVTPVIMGGEKKQNQEREETKISKAKINNCFPLKKETYFFIDRNDGKKKIAVANWRR